MFKEITEQTIIEVKQSIMYILNIQCMHADLTSNSQINNPPETHVNHR